jgi:carboxymethylenebutenolidase
MSEWVKLKTTDGVELQGYVKRPQGAALGGVVVVQEIFGVNKSIRAVVDHYAREGYVAIAPAIFDRIEPGVELGYDEAGMKKAFSLYPKLDPAETLKDIAAAFDFVKSEGAGTAVIGFCYGGLMSWLSATRGSENGFTPACTVGYYAGGVGKVAAEKPMTTLARSRLTPCGLLIRKCWCTRIRVPDTRLRIPIAQATWPPRRSLPMSERWSF